MAGEGVRVVVCFSWHEAGSVGYRVKSLAFKALHRLGA